MAGPNTRKGKAVASQAPSQRSADAESDNDSLDGGGPTQTIKDSRDGATQSQRAGSDDDVPDGGHRQRSATQVSEPIDEEVLTNLLEIEAQKQRLRDELAVIQGLKDIEELKRQIAAAKSSVAEPKAPDEAPAPRPRGDSATHAHHRDPTEGVPTGPEYHGKDMREWMRWKRVWEMHHSLAPSFFHSEERKILMAAVKLKDSIADTWQREVEAQSQQHTWITFTEFLRERIASKSVRIDKAQKALRTAKIGKNQSAYDYLTYIESLEADYPPSNEEQRVANYKLGLDDDILGLIALSTPEQDLDTREKWVKHVTRVRTIQASNTIIFKSLHKDHKNGDSAKQAQRTRSDDESQESAPKIQKRGHRGRGGWRGGSRGHASQTHPTSSAGAAPAQTENKRPAASSDMNYADKKCYNCQKIGHIKPHCPELKKRINQIEELSDSDTGDKSKNGSASR